MALKKHIKKNEARILIYIQNVDEKLCYPSKMSIKLQIDLSNMLKLINLMHEKNWIKKNKTIAGKTIIRPGYKCPGMNELLEARNG